MNEVLATADLLLFLADAFRAPAADWMAADPVLDALPEAAGLKGTFGLSALRSTTLDAWQREHDRLFEGANAPLSPHEGSWASGAHPLVLADIAAFHGAFGIDRRPGAAVRVDHLSAELELAALLCATVHRARGEGAREGEQVSRDGLAKFAADHLAEWVPRFCRALRAAAREPLYGELAELLEAVVARLLRP